MIKNTAVTFSDLKDRREAGEEILNRVITQLTKAVRKDPGVQGRLNDLTALQAAESFDAVLVAVTEDVDPGRLPFLDQNGRLANKAGGVKNVTTDADLEIMSVTGILAADGMSVDDPERGLRLAQDVRFQRALANARGEFRARKDLFEKVYEALGDEATVGVGNNKKTQVKAIDVARVARALASRGIEATDGYLSVYAKAVFNDVAGQDDEAAPSTIEIELPSLEAEVDVEIVKDNLDAMQALYFSATLEDLKLFQCVDKLVELFHQGMLPLGKGSAGNQLFAYWKKSTDRLTEVERRNLYARAFGFNGGDATTGSPNREFTDLWFRFVSGVSEYTRQVTIEQLLRDRIPYVVSAEQVRKSGRDLAANMSLYGYGVAYFAATEVQSQIKDILQVLGDDEIRSAYGARDVWQVVDQIATLELGGARNSVRQRTMATAGATIIRWLANNIVKLSSIGSGLFLDPKPNGYDPNHKPMVNPTDRDLIDACEQWLAVTGTSDQRVEEYSQPSEGPNMTSRPIQIPQVARDLLDSAGINSLQFSRS